MGYSHKAGARNFENPLVEVGTRTRVLWVTAISVLTTKLTLVGERERERSVIYLRFLAECLPLNPDR